MKKVSRSPGRRRGLSSRIDRGGATSRWVVVGGASLVCCALIAVRNGAEQVDSGWAVARPSPLVGSQEPNLEQQLVIRHVLEQTQPEPWLHKPATAQSTIEPKPAAAPRVATRSEGADGWRATN